MPEDRMFTPSEAAEYLGVAEATLNNWRVQRRGPAYVKVGPGLRARVKYRKSALDEAMREIPTADQPEVKGGAA